MELDDLKNDWESILNPNTLTTKAINQMTQKKYASKIKKIKYPELIGGVICLLGIGCIGFNFNKLDTFFLQSTGVLMMLLLVVLPAISLISLHQFNTTEDLSKPYVETIKQFAIKKLRFQKYQQANALLCYLLLVAIIILMPKLSNGKDITYSKTFWIFAFSFGYLFLLFFSKWVKKFYNKSLNEAEQLLKEVEQS